MSFEQATFSPEGMQPPPRAGMGCGTKVLIVVGVVGVLLIVVCCGMGGFAWWWGRAYMAKSFSEDPATIVRTTGELAKIDIPASLKPTMSMDMKVPFTDETLMVMAVYTDKESDSTLVLTAVGEAMGNQQVQVRQSMEQSLRDKGMKQERVVTENSAQEEVVIHGQKVAFNIARGKGADTKKPRIKVDGTFPGKNGPTMLILDVDAEKYSEEQVRKILGSIESEAGGK